MEKLTAAQAKQVIEYFAQQAAEDAPTDPVMYGRHMWLTLYTTSLAVERRIGKYDWDTLVERMIDLQSFDRDPEGWMTENGIEFEKFPYLAKDSTLTNLKDHVSWAIDNAYHNSGA